VRELAGAGGLWGEYAAALDEASDLEGLQHRLAEALAAWQLARLNETIAHARAASPFYRARRDWPDGRLTTIGDFARLPFTTAADLFANDPPLLALSQSAIARVVTLDTSGTSGPPKRLHFTPDDLESTVDFFHHGMALFARPGDRAAIAFPGGQPGGVAAGLAVALRRLGALPVAAPSPLDPVALAAWLLCRHALRPWRPSRAKETQSLAP